MSNIGEGVTEPSTAPTSASASLDELRATVREICVSFPDEYWRHLDTDHSYPEDFVAALTRSGLLAALVPKEYGGLGLGVTEASVILEEINRSGAHSAACHAQMYTMGALLKHGSEQQKRRWLPQIAAGKRRLQAFSVTEAEAGSDTTRITTTARPDKDGFVIDGQKNWTSRVEQSDLMLILVRTSERGDQDRRAAGLSLFLVDLHAVREEQPDALLVEPVRTMFNYATNRITLRGLRVPVDALVGELGSGFRCVIDGWNAERILLSAEAVGDGYWFADRATRYANGRSVFGRPLGANQGVAFPIARAYMQVRAADLMRFDAAQRFDAGEPLWSGSQHGQAAQLRGELGQRKRLLGRSRWQRVGHRLRRRTKVPRNAPLFRGPGQQQPRHRLRGHQCARTSALLLTSTAAPPLSDSSVTPSG